jgi:hypothetical protein
MDVNNALDQVLDALKQLAEAPKTSNVRDLQDLLRSKFSMLPEPPRPSGTEAKVHKGALSTPDEPGKAPAPPAAPPAPNIPSALQFTDLVPIEAGKTAACYQETPGSTINSWITGFSRSEDGRVLCVEVFASDFDIGIYSLNWMP